MKHSGLKSQPSSLPLLPYGKQSIDDDDIAAVVEALKSDYLTTGPLVERFEKALAERCGAKHAIAVSNGTAALHVAMLAAKIGPGDRVLTSANTFLASANCAAFVGATPDFVDIDPRTYNLSPDALASQWSDDVRAVVPVDFAGQPCDLPRIAEVAKKHKAVVIEDACHAVGSEFQHAGKWYKVGGNPWADMTALSFHPVKTITTGEGGAILTNNDTYAERCRLFRTHGMKRRAETGNLKLEDQRSVTQVSGLSPQSSSAPQVSGFIPQLSERGPWYYEMHELGYNYRITDLQCALGLSQLKKLDRFIKRRQEIVAQYNAAFANLAVVKTPALPPPQPSSFTTQPSGFSLHPSRISWHLYVLQIDFGSVGKTRTQVMTELRQKGVGSQVHYIPVHLQPYYRNKYAYAPGKCPVAEAYYQRCLSLPLYPAMTDVDVERVIQAVKEVTQVSGFRSQVS